MTPSIKRQNLRLIENPERQPIQLSQDHLPAGPLREGVLSMAKLLAAAAHAQMLRQPTNDNG